MTDNRYIKQLDPIQGLVDYVQDVKPYHTKIVDVMIEYVYNDDTTAVIKEDLNFAWGPTKFEACVVGGELVVPCNVAEGGAIQVGDNITINYEDGSPTGVVQVSEEITGVTYNGDYTILEFGSSPPFSVPATATNVLVLDDVTGYFSFDILSFDEEEQIITVNGPATAEIFNGQRIRVSGTIYNDGDYTIEGSPTFNGLHTSLPVAEPLTTEVIIAGSPSATVSPVRWYIPCGTSPCASTEPDSLQLVLAGAITIGLAPRTRFIVTSPDNLSEYDVVVADDASTTGSFPSPNRAASVLWLPGKQRWIIAGGFNGIITYWYSDDDGISFQNRAFQGLPYPEADWIWPNGGASMVTIAGTDAKIMATATTNNTSSSIRPGFFFESTDGGDTWTHTENGEIVADVDSGGAVYHDGTFLMLTGSRPQISIDINVPVLRRGTGLNDLVDVTAKPLLQARSLLAVATDGAGNWIGHGASSPETSITPGWAFSTDNAQTWQVNQDVNTYYQMRNVRKIAYHNSTWVAVGAGEASGEYMAKLGYSTDGGNTWTISTPIIDGPLPIRNLNDVFFYNDKWYMFGHLMASPTVAVALTTEDFVNFEVFTFPEAHAIAATGLRGAPALPASTAPAPPPSQFAQTWDWTPMISAEYSTAQPWYAAWGDGKLVACGGATTGTRFGGVAVSTDNVNWTTHDTPFTTSEDMLFIKYLNGLFVMGGTNGRLCTSVDGITWNNRAVGFGTTRITSAAYGNGRWVVVGDSAKSAYSLDGITWTFQAMGGSGAARGIAFGADLFVSPKAFGNQVHTSPDGITWTLQAFGSTFTPTDIIHHEGRFWVSATGGFNGFIVSTDGLTWSRVFSWARGTQVNTLTTIGSDVAGLMVGGRVLIGRDTPDGLRAYYLSLTNNGVDDLYLSNSSRSLSLVFNPLTETYFYGTGEPWFSTNDSISTHVGLILAAPPLISD